MIEKITRIKEFGILSNFQESQIVKPFNELNLIYGWNGSGKTTLARLFRCLETKANHQEYIHAEFTVCLENNDKVDSKTYTHSLDIRVFNQDFISENLNLFDAETNPIIFISKEKIEEKKHLDATVIELNARNLDFRDVINEKAQLLKKIDDIHKNAGKSIKDFLLGTIYANVNYNKATSTSIWKDLLKEDQQTDLELSSEGLANAKEFTLLNSKKEEISLDSISLKLDINNILAIANRVIAIIETNISAKVIDRLKQNPNINEWVYEGLQLCRENHNTNCDFCGGLITKQKVEELESHYSNEYQKFLNVITAQISNLDLYTFNELDNKNYLFYRDLQKEYDNIINRINKQLRQVNLRINEWLQVLLTKKASPFSLLNPPNIDITAFTNFNIEVDKLEDIVKKHNEISRSHDELAAEARIKIEHHFVSQIAREENLFDSEKQIEVLSDNADVIIMEKTSLEAALARLENELRSDTLAIAEINCHVHKFLGRNDILLVRRENGGYHLKRGAAIARNLSEGEKTAISLVYFFSKIQENNSLVSGQIIVLDDPISSFDSNHLFNASSFIKQSTIGAKQLFILTHNFWFFKQVRDWMNKEKTNVTNLNRSNFYVTKKGVILDAGRTLTKFHSEYQYVFSTVLSYQEMDNFDDAACFSIANSIRRLLEAFTSFKTPCEGNFDGALRLGLDKGLSIQQKDRIYFFVNKYSHLDRIESFDNTIETLLEEGKNVVDDVLLLIKKVDLDHYKSMLKVCDYIDKLQDY